MKKYKVIDAVRNTARSMYVLLDNNLIYKIDNLKNVSDYRVGYTEATTMDLVIPTFIGPNVIAETLELLLCGVDGAKKGIYKNHDDHHNTIIMLSEMNYTKLPKSIINPLLDDDLDFLFLSPKRLERKPTKIFLGGELEQILPPMDVLAKDYIDATNMITDHLKANKASFITRASYYKHSIGGDKDLNYISDYKWDDKLFLKSVWRDVHVSSMDIHFNLESRLNTGSPVELISKALYGPGAGISSITLNMADRKFNIERFVGSQELSYQDIDIADTIITDLRKTESKFDEWIETTFDIIDKTIDHLEASPAIEDMSVKELFKFMNYLDDSNDLNKLLATRIREFYKI